MNDQDVIHSGVEVFSTSTHDFESRKKDHIRLSMNEQNQALGFSGLESIELIHEALPEIDFKDLNIEHELLGKTLAAPFFVSSMTAGHADGHSLNLTLAKVCEKRCWAMGVGSQRRELFDKEAAAEWISVRNRCPDVMLFGNLGLSQLIQTPVSKVKELVDALSACAMIIHTNPLQEALQKEGTPEFKGGLKALENLCAKMSVPVILKETGCGFSKSTLSKLNNIGLFAVDISGLGGTHWGRIEGERAEPSSAKQMAAETFKTWGISTLESMENVNTVDHDYEVWASGGVRSGLDGAKLLSMGASMVGFAQPMMKAALIGEEVLEQLIETLEYELKVALFCTGHIDVNDLRRGKSWKKI